MAQVVLLALQLSIVGSVFAIGLGTDQGDLVSLFRRPWLLIRSFFAISVVMLVVAVALVRVMELPHVVAVAVVAMSLAPMPPILPRSMIKAGGSASFARGLLPVTGLISLLWIPLVLKSLGPVFGLDLGLSVGAIFKMIVITILAPLVVGALVARMFPAFARKIQQPVNLTATVVLVVALVTVLFRAWGRSSSRWEMARLSRSYCSRPSGCLWGICWADRVKRTGPFSRSRAPCGIRGSSSSSVE